MKKHLRYLHRGPNGARIKQTKRPDINDIGQLKSDSKIKKSRKSKLTYDNNTSENNPCQFQSSSLNDSVIATQSNIQNLTSSKSSHDVKVEKDNETFEGPSTLQVPTESKTCYQEENKLVGSEITQNMDTAS